MLCVLCTMCTVYTVCTVCSVCTMCTVCTVCTLYVCVLCELHKCMICTYKCTCTSLLMVYICSQVRNLVPSNFTHFNVTVTEVANINTATPKRRLVIFAVVFPKDTPLVMNFTTSINDGGKMAFNYIQGVVPSGTPCVECIVMYVCSV